MLLRKLGIGHSDDPQFAAAKKQFEESKKSLDKVNDHVTAFLLACQEVLKAQQKVAQDMTDQYGDPKSLPEGMVKDNIMLLEKMMLEKTRVDEEVRRGFQDPLNKYKAQYRELEERMRERSRRFDEMMKLEEDVKKYKAKNDARLSGTERRLTSAKQAYEDLHAELLEDIPKLVEDKVRFFEPMVAVLIDAQLMFYHGMSVKLEDVQSRITHIDRTAAGSHPKVIRPRQESAVGRSYSSFASSSGTGAAPRPSVGQSDYNTQQYATANSGYATNTGAYQTQPQGGYGGAPPPVPSRTLPPVPGQPAQPRARGLWDFNSVQPNELPFRTGDVLNIVDSSSGDWWTAELNGRQGLIPANYVQLI